MFQRNDRSLIGIKGHSLLEGSKEECDKCIELLNIFNDVSLDSIKAMLSSDVGALAKEVLRSNLNNIPVAMMLDELLAKHTTIDKNKFVTREAMLTELEDVLRAKSITAYRRSRINRALKQDCLQCQGTGEVKKRQGGHYVKGHCPHCKGSGTEPKGEQ